MNETRRKIIELIEPYMDKTEWLWKELMLWSLWIRDWKIYKLIKQSCDACEIYHFQNIENNKFLNIPYLWTKDFDAKIKILWHYDITAVLKYVYELDYDIDIDMWKAPWPTEFFIMKDDEHIAQLPNKPLHLYTEQEEKDLLNILNKLK